MVSLEDRQRALRETNIRDYWRVDSDHQLGPIERGPTDVTGFTRYLILYFHYFYYQTLP